MVLQCILNLLRLHGLFVYCVEGGGGGRVVLDSHGSWFLLRLPNVLNFWLVLVLPVEPIF